jgi:hypothetical protein
MASIPPRLDGDSGEARLPWLDGTRPPAANPVATHLGGSSMRWFVSLLILALVSAGAFVLGRGSGQTPLRPPVAVSLPSAQPAPQTAPVAATTPTPPAAKTPPALARAAEEPRPTTKVVRVIASARPSSGLHLSNEQIRAVRRIVKEAQVNVHRGDLPRVATAKSAYSPTVAQSGRVVQLGAYQSVHEAEAAAQLFRYKYRGLLEALPKAVLPFRPKATRKLFYRVQFITPSQAYSEVTCQRLRAAAKTCIVVY